MLVIAIDIGGSSIKSRVFDVDAHVASPVGESRLLELPSRDFADLEPLVRQVIREALSDHSDIRNVGISTTGSVDNEGTVVSAGHFTGYVNVSWQERLGRAFPVLDSVVTVNDGRAAAWAEFATDVTGAKSHVHAVIGTGVGGGIVQDGQLLRGDSGQAGYIGHIKVTTEETLVCSCGRHGCVEAVAAAPAIVKYWNDNVAASNRKRVESVEEVAAFARAAVPEAVNAFSRAGWWLGRGLGNAMNVLNPSTVTIGGGVLLASESIDQNGDGGLYFRAVRAGIEEAAHKRVFASAELRVSAHGNEGGSIGAALLACQLSHLTR